MKEKIEKYYKGIIPKDLEDDVSDLLKDIEVHQEEIVSNIKNDLSAEFGGLAFA